MTRHPNRNFRTSSVGVLFFYLILSILFSVPATGQSFSTKFRRLTTEQGLAHDNVYTIIQDRTGFLWIGTQDGMSRYDGYGFTTFRNNPLDSNSLSESNFGKLIQDRNGYIWCGTWGGGLDRFDPVRSNFTHFRHDSVNTDTISEDLVSALLEDPTGLIWIGTSHSGFNRFNPATGIFHRYQHDPDNPNSLSNDHIRSIARDESGILWIGTWGGGLDRFDPQTETFRHYPDDPSLPNSIYNEYVRAVCVDRQGGIWIGTRGGGMTLLDPQTGFTTHYTHREGVTNSLSDNNVNVIFQDSHGIIWIGTYSHGMDRYDPSTGRFTHFVYDQKDITSISQNRIEAIYEDQAGLLWIGTRGGGVCSLDLKPRNFIHYAHQEDDPKSLSSNTVYAILQDKTGTIWVGTDGGGLNRLHSGRSTDPGLPPRFDHLVPDRTRFPDISDARIWTLFEDRDGVLWVGSYNGLKILDRSQGEFLPLEGDGAEIQVLNHLIINVIAEDRFGVLWVGTANGLYRLILDHELPPVGPRAAARILRIRHYTHTPGIPTGISQNFVTALYEDRNGDLWVGTDTGLDCYDRASDSFKHYRHDPADSHSLSHPRIWAIYEDTHHRFWVGTAGGLNLLDRETGQCTHFLSQDGLPNNVISGILEDSSGKLWISTSNGLSRFDPEHSVFRNFDIHDGLLSNDFMHGACCLSSRGVMYFGGSRGMISFDPQHIKHNTHIPPVVLTSFRIFDRETGFHDNQARHRPLTLSHEQNFFSFEFSALDFTNPQKNQYMYMLEGFDRTWVHSGNRPYASYTNVPPGDYTFRVRGSNNDGIWNQTGASLSIIIVPPFWRTPFFQASVFLLVVGVIVMAFQWRTRAVEDQRKRLKEEVETRTRELNQSRNELRQAYSELEKRVQDRTRELAESNEALRRQVEERRRIEETLRILSLAVEQSPGTAIVVDTDFTVHYVNPMFTRTTGYTAEELVGARYDLLGEGSSSAVDRIMDELKSGEEWRAELQFRRKNGESYWESATITPIKDENGQITHFVKLGEDISHRKILEEQLRQSQKLEAIGHLAGGVAHDFNNILTAINGYTDLALRRAGEDSRLRKMLQEIGRSGQRGANLTRQLLAFSRKQAIAPVILDLNHLLNDLGRMLRRLVSEDISLELDLTPATAPILADPGQVEQIFLNLVVNAGDALNALPGGAERNKEIRITTEQVIIGAHFADQQLDCPVGECVRMCVSDNGIGMPADIQQRIFDPFFTTKGHGKGTGLGLSTVYGIVKQNGGFIKVTSEPGQGTLFSILWPVATPTPVINDPVGEETIPAGGEETILVVEDDPSVMRFIETVLGAEGYRVLTATNGRQALAVARAAGPIDLLFTDVIMPEMNGEELAEALCPQHPDMLVLFASGYTDEHLVRKGVLKSGIHFINKPYSRRQILVKIRELLDGVRHLKDEATGDITPSGEKH